MSGGRSYSSSVLSSESLNGIDELLDELMLSEVDGWSSLTPSFKAWT
jgi:hypothetical protein